ncbi:hypothetical protein N2601_31940 (plasmid) [Rhizobium sp. CB3060]|uniref:hypothetical protein n=1 Tax=Rhizobium sp. CB3060 TaxID=3138255 RepID=UPI0021A65C5B|nr:hypothetical protein [Rhizobium tropici]UWU25578.1 hypothetical protein N2601_31940 [Rhizobium tropici]
MSFPQPGQQGKGNEADGTPVAARSFGGSAGAAYGRNGFAVLHFVAAVPVHPSAVLLLLSPSATGRDERDLETEVWI